jgi:Flp pilus assembly protein TadD
MDAQCHNNLGFALEQAGRQQEAVGAYEKAIDINPTYALAKRNLNSLRSRIGESTPRE